MFFGIQVSFSQGEFNNWYFGQEAGVTFYSGSPVALTNCSPLFWNNYATCTVSDSLGNLLFYSDGYKVFNKNHIVMPNGSGLNPQTNSGTQIVFAVPELQNNNLFFLFTVDRPYTYSYPNPNGLRYSIINMQSNGGLGDIPSTQKNTPIHPIQLR